LRQETQSLVRHGARKGFRFLLGLALVFSCLRDVRADTWQIAAETRDAWDDIGSGNLNLANFGDLFWSDSAGYQWAATIPPGAQITSAKIRVYSNAHTGNTGAYTAQALLQELVNRNHGGNHERLGDAVLAAQEAYAETGAFPELSIYHLLGDPALRLR